MGQFLQDEKIEQVHFKINSTYFSNLAKADGIYKGKSYPFCLPKQHAGQNLYSAIRQPAIDYFHRNEIKWHDGQQKNPSNHMCDLQVCCVNFLFPFYNQPEALTELLRPLYPYIKHMLPIEEDQYVAMEWIGVENYLGEKAPPNAKRTRGANFTSADAAVRFERNDGRQQIVLIEWKYTESYSPSWLKFSRKGTDRTQIYRHLYLAQDCPLNKDLIPDFDSLFYEPFYQLMRQQFLTHEMEKAHELGADIVSLLHISPAHNHDFMRVTSPDLKRIEVSPTRIGKSW